MSAFDKDKMADLAISKDGMSLMILLSDYLDFRNEEKHRLVLQDKINAYISFIENQQYQEIYPDKVLKNIIIEIHLKYRLTENYRKFITVVNNQIIVLKTKCKIF